MQTSAPWLLGHNFLVDLSNLVLYCWWHPLDLAKSICYLFVEATNFPFQTWLRSSLHDLALMPRWNPGLLQEQRWASIPPVPSLFWRIHKDKDSSLPAIETLVWIPSSNPWIINGRLLAQSRHKRSQILFNSKVSPFFTLRFLLNLYEWKSIPEVTPITYINAKSTLNYITNQLPWFIKHCYIDIYWVKSTFRILNYE